MDYRLRICRPHACNDPGHAHELTFSCFHRYRFLSKDTPCKWLTDSIRQAQHALNYALWAYVFMPDHVHLVVCPKESLYDDSDFLKQIKEPVSRKAVQYLKRHAPLWLDRIRMKHGSRVEHHFWQPGRGYDRNVDESRTLPAVIDYIHLNPVRKGLVEQASDWKWSSAGWHAGRPLNELQPDPIPRDWLDHVD